MDYCHAHVCVCIYIITYHYFVFGQFFSSFPCWLQERELCEQKERVGELEAVGREMGRDLDKERR